MPDTILYWPFLITNILWTLEEMGTGNIGHNINLDKIRFEPTCNGIEHDLSSQTLKFLWASFSRVTSSHTMTSPVVVPTKWVNFINIGSKEKQKKPKAVLTDRSFWNFLVLVFRKSWKNGIWTKLILYKIKMKVGINLIYNFFLLNLSIIKKINKKWL